MEAALLFGGSFIIAAVVVWKREPVQAYLQHVGFIAYPMGALLMTIVASAPFSVTDALAIMNGVIFGPLWGSIVNAVGLVFAAIIAYRIAQRTNSLLDIESHIERMPAFVRRFPIASPPFLIFARLLPGIGGTLATQTAAAYNVGLWTQIWTKCVVAIPICTLLAVFGHGVAAFVHDKFETPVRARVQQMQRDMHFPRHHSPSPVVMPTGLPH